MFEKTTMNNHKYRMNKITIVLVCALDGRKISSVLGLISHFKLPKNVVSVQIVSSRV